MEFGQALKTAADQRVNTNEIATRQMDKCYGELTRLFSEQPVEVTKFMSEGFNGCEDIEMVARDSIYVTVYRYL